MGPVNRTEVIKYFVLVILSFFKTAYGLNKSNWYNFHQSVDLNQTYSHWNQKREAMPHPTVFYLLQGRCRCDCVLREE